MAIEFSLITTTGATLIEVTQDGVTDGAQRSTENTVNVDENGSFTVQTFQTLNNQPKRWIFIREDVTINSTILAGDVVSNATLKAKLYEIFFLDEAVEQNLRLGAINSTPAANPSTVTGLSGILRGFWAALVALLPTSLTSLGNFKVAIQERENLIDAAGRLKVSVPNPQVSVKYRYDKLPLLVDEKGTGTATFDNPNSCVLMSVTAGQYLVRQTFKKGNYVSGIGLVSEFTTSNFQVEAGVEKRIGYISSSIVAPYDSAYDGICLFNDGITHRLQVWRSGTLVHNVPQASWNDPLNGSGASGVTVDWSKAQLFSHPIIWLSVGNVPIWFYYEGIWHIIHTITNANIQTYAYITSPNQPIRYEIRSTGGVGSMNQICASIYDDGGGTVPIKGGTGQPFTIKSGITNTTATTAGTAYAMLGVRLASGRLDANVLITALSGMNTSNNFGRISLIRNPAVANVFTYGALTNTPIEYAIGAGTNTVTGGFEVESWPFDRSLSTSINSNVGGLLGSGVDGAAEEYVLCVTPNANNLTWFAQMNLIELI